MIALSGFSGAMRRDLPVQPPEKLSAELAFPDNMAFGLDRSVSGGLESGWHQDQSWMAQAARKPPQPEGINSAFLADTQQGWLVSRSRLVAEVEGLKILYKFRNEPTISRFCLTHPAAVAVLSAAASELKRSFGDDAVLDLETITDEDDSTSIYGIVVWSGRFEKAETALNDFDERWWLHQPVQAGLTFTYELA